MSRTPQRARKPPVRRPTARRPPPARRVPARPAPRAAHGSGSAPSKAAKGALIAVGAVVVLLVAWRIAAAVLGGASDERVTPTLGPTGTTGTVGEGNAPPAPPGSRSATFPVAVEGTRLELKVIALGADPPDCRAESLDAGGGVRAVYHHECLDEGDLDRYFFLVRLTNVTDGRVYVNLDGFAIVTAAGEARSPFGAPPLGSPATRFLPATRAIAAGESLKGWLTVDGSDGFEPAKLSYGDGAELLSVVFEGDWV